MSSNYHIDICTPQTGSRGILCDMNKKASSDILAASDVLKESTYLDRELSPLGFNRRALAWTKESSNSEAGEHRKRLARRKRIYQDGAGRRLGR